MPLMNTNFSRKYFYYSLGFFAASFLAGVIIGNANITETKNIINQDTGFLGAVKDWPNYLLFIFIFLNNTIKAFLAIFLGFFFALFPIYFICSNGFLIGLFFIWLAKNNSLSLFLSGTLPHGILEIFAIILSCSYGIWIGSLYYQKWVGKRDIDTGAALRLCWRKYYKVILPLLLIAALIETFITPMVMNRFS